MVWVHDYHLQLVPEMLRARRPDLRIGFFLHIPFPPQELFMQLPWRKEISARAARRRRRGLPRADRSGQLPPSGPPSWVANGRGHSLHLRGPVVAGRHPSRCRSTSSRSRPWPRRRAVQARAIEIRQGLGSPEHVLLGVDRLDYTKGIDLRLQRIPRAARRRRARSSEGRAWCRSRCRAVKMCTTICANGDRRAYGGRDQRLIRARGNDPVVTTCTARCRWKNWWRCIARPT